MPMNGTYIASSVMLNMPTSRGSVGISSTSPEDSPLIDSNYYATKADSVSLLHETRRVLQLLLGTLTGKAYIEAEVAPPGLAQLTTESSDADIDARIRATGNGRRTQIQCGLSCYGCCGGFGLASLWRRRLAYCRCECTACPDWRALASNSICAGRAGCRDHSAGLGKDKRIEYG